MFRFKPIRTSLRAALVGCLAFASCGGDTGGKTDAGALQWYTTCGDPVCRGYTPPAGIARCGTEKEHDACTASGTKCDPMSDCNALLICTSSDPKTAPGGCPVSHRAAKTEIKYLGEGELKQLADELTSTRLATYRYKAGGPARLGFMIDDRPLSMSVDPERDMVDLYGYTSMTVAAIKVQAQRIATLEAELAAIKKQLASPPSSQRRKSSAR